MNAPWQRSTVRGPMIGDRLELQPDPSGCLIGLPRNPGRRSDCAVAITADTRVEIGELPEEWQSMFGLSQPVVGVLHPDGSLSLPELTIPVLPGSLTVDIIQGKNTLR